MSTPRTRHWAQTLRAAFSPSRDAAQRAEPQRRNQQHRMGYLDNARMAREMGHL